MHKKNQRKLSEAERSGLRLILDSGSAGPRVLRRAMILLLDDEGRNNTEIAEVLGIDRITVGRALRHFSDGGLENCLNMRRPGGARPRPTHEKRVPSPT